MTFMVAALVAAGFYAASAFNYADLAPRNVDVTIVTDNNGYLAIASYDADYACYTEQTVSGIDVTWDGGTSCADSGTGINPDSDYYFHDVLIITNKGTKTITNIWLNMTAASKIYLNINSAAGTMTTGDSYAYQKSIANLAPGASYYIGFHIDATGLTTANSPISDTLSIEARTTT